MPLYNNHDDEHLPFPTTADIDINKPAIIGVGPPVDNVPINRKCIILLLPYTCTSTACKNNYPY